MSEPSRPLRPGRGSRPSPASLGIVKVDADFEDEYPGGDTTCTEAYASLCRTGEALLGELDRRIAATFRISQAAATALAVIDGAGTPLTPSQVADRVLIASATMTATLDLLERRGWIRRVPNPADRRSVLIEITPEGRATTDQLLPGIRTVEQGHPVRPHPRRTGIPAGPARQDPDPDSRSRRRTTRAPPRPAQPARQAHPPARRRARSPANLRHRYSRTPKARLRNAPKSPAMQPAHAAIPGPRCA